MGTVELRKEVRSYIDKADERFLRMVDALRKEYEEPDVVGYEVDGTPITQEDLKIRVKAASARVKAGHYTTQEDLEKEMESW
jgi:predicted ribonuclease YlaK